MLSVISVTPAFAQSLPTVGYQCSVVNDTFMTPEQYETSGVEESKKLAQDLVLTTELAQVNSVIREMDTSNGKVHLVATLSRDNYSPDQVIAMVRYVKTGPGFMGSEPLGSMHLSKLAPTMFSINKKALESENDLDLKSPYSDARIKAEDFSSKKIFKKSKKAQLIEEMNLVMERKLEKNRDPENQLADQFDRFSRISVVCKKLN
ncbi:MAG: hypothetical protein JNL01_03785 [Bdellovibrionales bacterium]|nr:hypothetical protein [Bdellovibrionales bacterium]